MDSYKSISNFESNEFHNIGFASVTSNIRLQCGWYNLISITAYELFTDYLGQKATYTAGDGTVSDAIISSEMVGQTFMNFTIKKTPGTGFSYLRGPEEVIMPAASQSGLAHWHWSAKDQTVLFRDN